MTRKSHHIYEWDGLTPKAFRLILELVTDSEHVEWEMISILMVMMAFTYGLVRDRSLSSQEQHICSQKAQIQN